MLHFSDVAEAKGLEVVEAVDGNLFFEVRRLRVEQNRAVWRYRIKSVELCLLVLRMHVHSLLFLTFSGLDEVPELANLLPLSFVDLPVDDEKGIPA